MSFERHDVKAPVFVFFEGNFEFFGKHPLHLARFAEKISFGSNGERVNVFELRTFYGLSEVEQIEIRNSKFTLYEGAFFYCAGGEGYRFCTLRDIEIYVINFDFFKTVLTVKVLCSLINSMENRPFIVLKTPFWIRTDLSGLCF